MYRIIVMILFFLTCFVYPAAAVSREQTRWFGSVIETMQALSVHRDLKAVAISRMQTLTVRFVIQDDGRVGRLEIRKGTATRQASATVRRLLQDLRFRRPCRICERVFPQRINIGAKAPSKEQAAELTRKIEQIEKEMDIVRRRYNLPRYQPKSAEGRNLI